MQPELKLLPTVIQICHADRRAFGQEKSITESVAREAIPHHGPYSYNRAPLDRLVRPAPKPAPLMNKESILDELDTLIGGVHYSAQHSLFVVSRLVIVLRG